MFLFLLYHTLGIHSEIYLKETEQIEEIQNAECNSGLYLLFPSTVNNICISKTLLASWRFKVLVLTLKSINGWVLPSLVYKSLPIRLETFWCKLSNISQIQC